jgi:hypothetical protein
MNELIPAIDPTVFGMWATFAVIVVALALYTLERVSLELTSLGVICVLLVFFHFNPVRDAAGPTSSIPRRFSPGLRTQRC